MIEFKKGPDKKTDSVENTKEDKKVNLEAGSLEHFNASFKGFNEKYPEVLLFDNALDKFYSLSLDKKGMHTTNFVVPKDKGEMSYFFYEAKDSQKFGKDLGSFKEKIAVEMKNGKKFVCTLDYEPGMTYGPTPHPANSDVIPVEDLPKDLSKREYSNYSNVKNGNFDKFPDGWKQGIIEQYGDLFDRLCLLEKDSLEKTNWSNEIKEAIKNKEKEKFISIMTEHAISYQSRNYKLLSDTSDLLTERDWEAEGPCAIEG